MHPSRYTGPSHDVLCVAYPHGLQSAAGSACCISSCRTHRLCCQQARQLLHCPLDWREYVFKLYMTSIYIFNCCVTVLCAATCHVRAPVKQPGSLSSAWLHALTWPINRYSASFKAFSTHRKCCLAFSRCHVFDWAYATMRLVLLCASSLRWHWIRPRNNGSM
jgi:hypothetical protein